jgi:hypothetical protein
MDNKEPQTFDGREQDQIDTLCLTLQEVASCSSCGRSSNNNDITAQGA